MHIVWAAVGVGRYRDLPSLQNVIPDGDADFPGRPVVLQRYSPRYTRGLPCQEISKPRGISREHGRPGRTRRSTAVRIADPAAVVYSLTPTIAHSCTILRNHAPPDIITDAARKKCGSLKQASAFSSVSGLCIEADRILTVGAELSGARANAVICSVGRLGAHRPTSLRRAGVPDSRRTAGHEE